jgi:hypothetical protein
MLAVTRGAGEELLLSDIAERAGVARPRWRL